MDADIDYIKATMQDTPVGCLRNASSNMPLRCHAVAAFVRDIRTVPSICHTE